MPDITINANALVVQPGQAIILHITDPTDDQDDNWADEWSRVATEYLGVPVMVLTGDVAIHVVQASPAPVVAHDPDWRWHIDMSPLDPHITDRVVTLRDHAPAPYTANRNGRWTLPILHADGRPPDRTYDADPTECDHPRPVFSSDGTGRCPDCGHTGTIQRGTGPAGSPTLHIGPDLAEAFLAIIDTDDPA